MNKTAQKQKILQYMMEHPKGITPQDAQKLCGSMRLGARIWDLRHDGHQIERELVRREYTDRDGEVRRVQFARYYMAGGVHG